ncbi:MAG: hypothetical protein IJC19_02800 [Clostridia bacterium]|nr:hypothetical protein [Clostridia bacterium]
MKTLLSKKSILSILMVLAILSSGVFSFYAVDSYSLYMSQERPLTKTSPTAYNSDWLEEPFVMREGLLDDYQSFYEDAQISVGNVYQERLVNGELELVCLATGNFENYNHSGNNMYLSVGGTISHLDLTTWDMSVIYTGDTSVANLWVFDGIIFFQVADSIYHYYCPTETLRLLTTVEDIRAWKPMSNYVIQIVEDNPLYYEAVAASGVSENEQPTDVAAFSAWLNQNLSLETSPESNVLQQCDVQNILSASGVGSVNCYWYNAVTNQVLSEYTEPEQPLQAQTFQLTRSSTATAKSSTALQSVTPVVWKYATGNYFSKDKINGCKCHGHEKNCDLSFSGNCDCELSVENAIQCNGYARQVFYDTSSYRVGQGTSVSFSYSSSISDADLWNFFDGKIFPIFLGVVGSEGAHYILVYGASTEKIYICEANNRVVVPSGVNHRCYVKNYQALTYYEFKSRYSSVLSAVVPPAAHTHIRYLETSGNLHWIACTTCDVEFSTHHTPAPYYDITEDMHCLLCSTCGMIMSQAEYHEYDIDGYCVCGAILAK